MPKLEFGARSTVLAPMAPLRPALDRVASSRSVEPPAPPAPPQLPNPDQYYAIAQGKKGVDLLKALSTIVSGGPLKVFTYEEARELMYGQLDDPTDTNVVTDVYTGQKYTGVAGIRSAFNKGLTAEHVWPQSTGATAGAKSDLHHIITCSGTVNSMRSNLPYGEVKTTTWTSPEVPGVNEKSILGHDEKGTKVFQPRASMEGDLARMQLYFFTRYHGEKPKKYSLNNFKVSLPSLLKWNREDPPDAAERARNEAIYKLQGNRNPFVDHPEWVDAVGFNPEMLRRPNVRKVANQVAAKAPVAGAAQAVVGARLTPAA